MKKLIKQKQSIETQVIANKLMIDNMENIKGKLKVKGDKIRDKFKKYEGRC